MTTGEIAGQFVHLAHSSSVKPLILLVDDAVAKVVLLNVQMG